MMSFTEASLRAIGHIYGFLALLATGTRAFVEGSIIRRLPSSFYRRVEKERERFWDLNLEPEGFRHRFLQTKTAALHYVTDAKTSESSKSSNLVIFIHGWPDSWMLWRDVWRQSEAKSKEQAIYVALDLPGFGGSESLSKYSPHDVLEPISEFILTMRERHWSPGPNGEGEVIVVAHDWGALCGFRLAAEAGALADRFILANAGLPAIILGNVRGRLATTRRMLVGWLSRPLNLKLLFKALVTLFPVLVQLKNSFYIAIFNLPYPLPKWFLSVGHYGFLKLAGWIAVGQRCPLDDDIMAQQLASSLGPLCGPEKAREAKLASSKGVTTYPSSVLERDHIGSAGNGLGFYRDGLTLLRWEKSIELVAALHELEETYPERRRSSNAGVFDEGPRGAMKAKVTVLFGALDPALDPRIMLNGIKDYMVRGSQLVMLPQVGHWVPVEGEGTAALSEAVAWALEGADASKLNLRINSVCSDAKMTVSK